MLVVFDLGGVVFDVDWDAFAQSMRERTGTSGRLSEAMVPDYKEAMRGASFDPVIAAFEPGSIGAFAVAYADAYERAAPLRDEVLAIIDALREHHTVVALSNTNEIHALVHRTRGLVDRFEQVFFSCETGLVKPDPDSFTHVLSTCGFTASESVFIDDNAENVDAFERLGGTGIVYTENLADELRRQGVSVRIDP